MSDQDPPPSGVNVDNSGDLRVGGDVTGRDKITTTTTVNEGGPVARYAVIGLVIIAVIAIIVIAGLARAPQPPPPSPSPTPTQGLTETPRLEASPRPSPTFSATPTDTRIPTATSPPTATATPTASPTPTDTATPTPSATHTGEPPRPTFTATSALALLDDFNDNCLSANQWELIPEAEALDTPTPPPNACLQTQAQFFTEGADGHLAVFVSVEGAQTHTLREKSGACFRTAEVTLALDSVQISGTDPGSAYLAVGLGLERISGPGVLEIRLEGGTTSGRLGAQATARFTNATGYINLGALEYQFGQRVTLTLRASDIGALNAPTAKKITAYLNGIPLGPPLSLTADPCGLTLGYHADAPATLEGYFDEVRLVSVE